MSPMMNKEEHVARRNWYAKPLHGGQGIIADEDTGRSVAVVYDVRDAAIVAAAPKMKKLLQRIVHIVENEEPRQLVLSVTLVRDIQTVLHESEEIL